MCGFNFGLHHDRKNNRIQYLCRAAARITHTHRTCISIALYCEYMRSTQNRQLNTAVSTKYLITRDGTICAGMHA